MTPDPRRFAELLCGYCLDVQPGSNVLVTTTTLAAPAVLAIQSEILRRGGWPLMRVSLPEQEAGWLRDASDVHLDSVSPSDLMDFEMADRFLTIQAPDDPAALSDMDPHRKSRRDAARAQLSSMRLAKRWCGTLWPTEGAAAFAGMSFPDFARFVERAMFLDQPDPEAAWRALGAKQQRLVDRMSRAREVRIEGPGTDLRLRVDGRVWVNSDGKRNMPSGEIFTGPHEDSAQGRIRFDIACAHQGNRVSGVELVFEDGLVTSAVAEEGADYLMAMLDSDAGARSLGELGIGTNFGIDSPTGSILFDEKIGGTVHLALGRSYPETGGTNASGIHWDLICDLRAEGQVTVDGEPLDVRGAMS